MNLIQTFYIDNSKNPFKDTFGWAAPEYHIMSWVLSCLQLNKLYGNVELYANSKAFKLLINTLKLPYSNVHITHDKLILPNKELWALPKIHTYSLQEKPFLHIDGDVFLFNEFEPSFLDNDLIAQNIEVATIYYISTQKELMQHFTYFPNCVRRDFEAIEPIHAVNAGILGGNNIEFISEYAKTALEYINKNINNLQNIDVNKFNVFFEQHLFYALAKEKGISISVLFSDIINDNGYKYLGDFHEVPFNRSYLHLLGHFKRDEYTCIRMAAKLRELYPEYYYKILSLFGKDPLYYPLHCSDTTIDFKSLHKVSIKAYEEQKIDAATEKNICDKSKNIHLSQLKEIANSIPINQLHNEFLHDFEIFYNTLCSVLDKNISELYLYGRDLVAVHWYRDIFANESGLLDKILVKCAEIEIIQSKFDWAGLFNKYYRYVVEYYTKLQIVQGHYYNLIVPEVSGNKFSLYDIDQLDYEIINQLVEPLSVKDLMLKMQVYFEDDVVQNHYDIFYNLITSCLKHLVEKKIIKPI